MHTHHHRPHINLRIERWHRRAIYISFAVLMLSGLAWLVTHYFLRPVGEFGETVHPAEPLAMKLHGGAAMVVLFFLGSLMNAHIRRAIKAGRNQVTGWSMIVFMVMLVASGFGLYYLASDSNRMTWSLAHWITGLLGTGLFVLHIVWGRRQQK
ncbi:DUF4405 domain-containing protein [Duganella sp. CY15W]|uniref:DUF4405 domain-containing protein n=1 Tax=Duganella sp. CY15W TaxID=2692172 RepID=UPI001370F82B|nr:DUF4405 domain-containing protein [Duganella sp. CY15W]MYM31381.1 DUF4405 domain-containing protein [Duganella sp. CY15W]